MGHCQIPPEGIQKGSQKNPMSSCKNWEHFSGRWDTFFMGRGEGRGKKKRKEGWCSPSPSCEAQPKLLCTAPWRRLSLSAASAWEILHSSPGLTLTGETWIYMRHERLAKCGLSQCTSVATQTLCLPPRALAKPKASTELHQNQEKSRTVNCCQWACCTLQL